MEHIPVLIAGGGPVGMILAHDLARRGIRSILVERNFSTTIHPKMDITNARSMELLRHGGLADLLRRVAVAEDHCFDVSWITNFTGHELHRFRYPSVSEHRALIRATNDGTQPAESPMRVSQVEIEPVLKAAIEAEPLVDVRFGVEFEDMAQDADGVTVTLRDRRTEKTSQVRCAYLAGCDGGSSRVRACLGISLSGDARIMQRFTVHFRSPRRDLLLRWGRAWHYQSPLGTLVAQNDDDVWTLHARIAPDVAVDSIRPAEVLAQFVGEPIEHEVLVANPWTPHLLAADTCGRGRVWLAGDAVHQYIPTGGYGMNTGVCEAYDLSWKLAAVLKGFGGPDLLDSVEIERRPVALRNREGSRRHADVRLKIAAVYSPALQEAGAAGDAARREAGARIAALGNAENESMGIELGYAYRDSPIVASEPGAEWSDDPLTYRPTTAPGARLPSVFLADGQSLYDKLGPWFTALAVDSRGAAGLVAFRDAAGAMNIPLQAVSLQRPDLRLLYQSDLLLVRPDQHVAWRGAGTLSVNGALAVLRRSLGWGE